MFYIRLIPEPLRHLAVLLALCGVLYFPHLGRIPFFNKGEPREAMVVREIVSRKSWLFPLKGEEIPSKPPLFHWFGALASLALGQVTEATVRLPSAILATLGVVLLYLWGRKIFDSKSALFGAAMLATTPEFQGQAVAARVDMTLTFFIIASLTLFYALYRGFLGNYGYYAFYCLYGLSVLAKGPIGLLLPGMVILAFIGLKKRWDFLYRLCLHKGIFLLLIGISWYGQALLRGGDEFFRQQIMDENIARFFYYGEEGSGHQKPFYYYVPYLILEGLPWSLFLPFVLMGSLKKKSIPEERLFLALWAGIVFLFFSLSAGKRSVYILPLYPALSLLVAAWLNERGEDFNALGLKSVGWLSLIIGLALFLPLATALWRQDPAWLFSYVSMVLKPKDQARFSVILDWPRETSFIFLFGSLLFACAWISAGLRLLAADSGRAVTPLVLLSILAGFLAHGVLIPSVAQSRSYKSFVHEANRRIGAEAPVFIYGEGWDYNSVIFYRGDRVPVLKGSLLFLEKNLRESEGYFVMGETEWRKISASSALPVQIELRSRGVGPEGRDPIVLVRGLKKENR